MRQQFSSSPTTTFSGGANGTSVSITCSQRIFEMHCVNKFRIGWKMMTLAANWKLSTCKMAVTGNETYFTTFLLNTEKVDIQLELNYSTESNRMQF